MFHLLEKIGESIDLGNEVNETCAKINSLICQRDNIAGDIDSLSGSAKLKAQDVMQDALIKYAATGSDEALAEKCGGFCDFLAEKGFWTPKQWEYLAYHVLPKIAGK